MDPAGRQFYADGLGRFLAAFQRSQPPKEPSCTAHLLSVFQFALSFDSPTNAIIRGRETVLRNGIVVIEIDTNLSNMSANGLPLYNVTEPQHAIREFRIQAGTLKLPRLSSRYEPPPQPDGNYDEGSVSSSQRLGTQFSTATSKSTQFSNGIMCPDLVIYSTFNAVIPKRTADDVKLDNSATPNQHTTSLVTLVGEHKVDEAKRPEASTREALAQNLIQLGSSFEAFGTFYGYILVNLSFARLVLVDKRTFCLEVTQIPASFAARVFGDEENDGYDLLQPRDTGREDSNRSSPSARRPCVPAETILTYPSLFDLLPGKIDDKGGIRPLWDLIVNALELLADRPLVAPLDPLPTPGGELFEAIKAEALQVSANTRDWHSCAVMHSGQERMHDTFARTYGLPLGIDAESFQTHVVLQEHVKIIADLGYRIIMVSPSEMDRLVSEAASAAVFSGRGRDRADVELPVDLDSVRVRTTSGLSQSSSGSGSECCLDAGRAARSHNLM
jgi:hypothetical protein